MLTRVAAPAKHLASMCGATDGDFFQQASDKWNANLFLSASSHCSAALAAQHRQRGASLRTSIALRRRHAARRWGEGHRGEGWALDLDSPGFHRLRLQRPEGVPASVQGSLVGAARGRR